MTDEELADILLGMGDRPLRELNAERTNFGPLSGKALLWRDGGSGEGKDLRGVIKADDHRFHPCQLDMEVLLVAGSQDSGTMVQQFLCGFPNLKPFTGSYLAGQDVLADPRPWVCKDLQMLKLPLVFELEGQTDTLVSPCPSAATTMFTTMIATDAMDMAPPSSSSPMIARERQGGC